MKMCAHMNMFMMHTHKANFMNSNRKWPSVLSKLERDLQLCASFLSKLSEFSMILEQCTGDRETGPLFCRSLLDRDLKLLCQCPAELVRGLKLVVRTCLARAARARRPHEPREASVTCRAPPPTAPRAAPLHPPPSGMRP
ncbi:unnamed protein product [Colias eurytheme]|nr:unnamed protein product [Colias eurytheme]